MKASDKNTLLKHELNVTAAFAVDRAAFSNDSEIGIYHTRGARSRDVTQEQVFGPWSHSQTGRMNVNVLTFVNNNTTNKNLETCPFSVSVAR